MGLLDRVKHGWNAFMNRDPTNLYRDIGSSYFYRPDRPRLTRGNERSIVTSVYNRIALDVAAINIKHCKLDENGRFIEEINSHLNNCLNIEANIDQTGRAFIQDVVMSMLDEGCVAIVPTTATANPDITQAFDIGSMRTAKIVEWYPQHVKVKIYNETTGKKEDLILTKKSVAIIENPLFAVINEPNSTMQRLIRKLNLLDIIDEQSGSGKLDLIIQLPYVIKSEARRQQAEGRRKDIEMQLERIVPKDFPYVHTHMLPTYGTCSGNGPGHLKSMLVGNHCIFPVIDGKMMTGGEQNIYFAELDGLQIRHYFIEVMGE